MLSVIIPAYNEEKKIAETIQAVRKVPVVSQILVVDDGSTDATAAKAEDAGAEVLRLGKNKGKGEALNSGIPLLTKPYIAMLDGDLGSSAAELHLLVEPVLNDKTDLVIAGFPVVAGSGGFGLVKGLAKFGLYLLTGASLNFALSGQRVMTRRVLNAVYPFASGYGVEIAMTIRAARKGFRITEIPTAMTHRITGKSIQDFWHRGRQFFHILRALVKEIR